MLVLIVPSAFHVEYWVFLGFQRLAVPFSRELGHLFVRLFAAAFSRLPLLRASTFWSTTFDFSTFFSSSLFFPFGSSSLNSR
jgi:hypothetical protein